MQIKDVAQRLMAYFSPEEREIPDDPVYPGRNEAVRVAINSALQELFGASKPWTRKDERGTRVHAPASIPITVTQDSTTATIDPGDWKSWFAGCTIVIEGSDVDNQIRNDSSAVVLKYPYSGDSGIKTATVYHDSVTVDADVMSVFPTVRLDRRPLSQTRNALTLQSNPLMGDYGLRRGTLNPTPTVARVTDTAGTPTAFQVKTWTPANNTDPAKIRIMLAPAPTTDGFLDYEVTILPPSVTELDSTDTLPIPYGYSESIFYPIAAKNLSESPFFQGSPDSVAVSYKSAIALLAASTPNRAGGPRIISIG